MQDGSLCPDEAEVRALTEEHSREMAIWLADLTHLKWCSKHQLDPRTGRPPKPNSRVRLEERLKNEIVEFAHQYESCLDAAVRRFVEMHFPKEPPRIQKQLF